MFLFRHFSRRTIQNSKSPQIIPNSWLTFSLWVLYFISALNKIWFHSRFDFSLGISLHAPNPCTCYTVILHASYQHITSYHSHHCCTLFLTPHTLLARTTTTHHASPHPNIIHYNTSNTPTTATQHTSHHSESLLITTLSPHPQQPCSTHHVTLRILCAQHSRDCFMV